MNAAHNPLSGVRWPNRCADRRHCISLVPAIVLALVTFLVSESLANDTAPTVRKPWTVRTVGSGARQIRAPRQHRLRPRVRPTWTYQQPVVKAPSESSLDPDAVPGGQRPPAPTGLRPTAVTGTSVGLSWDAASDNSGASRYRVYERVRIHRAVRRWILRHDKLTDPSSTLSDLDPGTTHVFAVTVLDDAGNESRRSATLRVRTLRPPTVYLPVAPGRASVRAIVGEPFHHRVAAIGVPAPSFTLVDGPAGMTIETRTGIVRWTPPAGAIGAAKVTVRATNSQGADDYSFNVPILPAGTDLEPPSPVPHFAATKVTPTGSTLVWRPASDNVAVAGYRILAQAYGKGNSLFVAGDTKGPATRRTVTGLVPNKAYRIWVTAYDAAGNVAPISGIPGVTVLTPAVPNPNPKTEER